MNNKQCFFVWLLFISIELVARHPFRIANPLFPQVTAQWEDGSFITILTNRYIRYYPMFAFHISQFDTYLLPPQAIPFGNDPSKSIMGTKLAILIEEGMTELLQKKSLARKNKTLTHFIILQDKNFNYRQSCGLIVLAFKHYPFVVKLFMEKPNTILDFHATGLEPTFFFYMGGGSNRHLSGLTRLANREFIMEKIKNFEQWKHHIELPRKWFWLPQKQHNIVLMGKNIENHAETRTIIPGVYAIIADKIDFSKETSQLSTKQKGDIIMQLCNDLELNIDPHAKNFSFIEDKEHQKFKITIVDTEHFPTMVGSIKKRKFRNHNEWYLFLAGKCFTDMYLTTKREALSAHDIPQILSIADAYSII